MADTEANLGRQRPCGFSPASALIKFSEVRRYTAALIVMALMDALAISVGCQKTAQSADLRKSSQSRWVFPHLSRLGFLCYVI
jgi:hypothetical protein